MNNARPTPDRRPRAWIRFAIAAALVLLLLAFFGASQLIVSTRLLRSWVNDEPEKLLVDYDSASSWIPGVVRVRGLRVRGRDPNVEWFFRIDDARICVSLPDLLIRRFHATRVRGSGLTFRLREKPSPTEFSPAHAALLPTIPGFPNETAPSRPQPRGVPPPEPPSPGKPWTIQVDRLVADPAPEIWIELYRFRGHARVTGGFFLHPRVEARINPSSVEFLSGTFTLGPQTPIATGSGRADCRIERFDPEKVRGNDVWRYISGAFGLRGQVANLKFVDHFLRNSPEPRLDGGRGSGHAEIRVDHGIGTGRIDFAGRQAGARYSDAVVRGNVILRGNVRRWDFEHDTIDLSGTRVELDDVVSTGRHQDSRQWWGHFDLKSAEIRRGFSTSLEVHCRDARPLFRLFDVELPGWAQGLLKLDGIRAAARVRLAREIVELRGFEATGGRFHLAGDYQKKGTSAAGEFLVETGPLAVGIDVGSQRSVLKVVGARKWFQERRAEEAGRRAG